MKKIKLLVAIATIALTININAQTYVYDFESGYEGWTGDFADYPVIDSVFYELEFIRTTLPAPLDTTKYALKISGNNHSDDLFMFIKRRITGLTPNTTYQLLIDVDFASNAPTNAFGVGGPPGEGVRMKIGASTVEPIKIDSNGFYQMNIDKGNQSSPGVDMDTIGHVGVSDTTTVFTLINRNNAAHLFPVTTDANGEVWVSIGTDSGFEATTTIYYDQITLMFTTVVSVNDANPIASIVAYPNPTSDWITVKGDQNYVGQTYSIVDQSGRQILSGILTSENSTISITTLTDGMYYLRIGDQTIQSIKFLKN